MNRNSLRWCLIALGSAGFLLLLSHFGVSSILLLVRRVGWALLFLLALEFVAEVANAAGWRFCFSRESLPPPPFASLIRLRIAGDGLNYLVPTATVGGELLRINLLDPGRVRADRTASVVLARMAQDIALASLAAAGFWLVARHSLSPEASLSRSLLWLAPVAAAFLAAVFVAVWQWMARCGDETRVGRLRRRIEDAIVPAVRQLRSHPARFAGAIAIFGAGYLWGSVEAFWICRLIGRPVSPGVAVQIEILSLTIDAIVFLVPARIGTQEAGKTLIFALLGMPARDGFAFGVIRHVRELFWAGLGLVIGLRSPWKAASGQLSRRSD